MMSSTRSGRGGRPAAQSRPFAVGELVTMSTSVRIPLCKVNMELKLTCISSHDCGSLCSGSPPSC